MLSKILKLLKKYRSILFLIIIILLALKVFIPQLDQLKESLQVLAEAKPSWVMLGLVLYFLGIPVVTWQYMVLVFHKLQFWLTFKVQMSSLFVSKLLPSSLGTITINVYYFMQKKHTFSQATTIMAVNAITSGIAYAFLIVVALLVSGFRIHTIISSLDISETLLITIVLSFVLLMIFLLRTQSIRAKISYGWASLRTNIITYRNRPKDLIIAIITNGVGSFLNVFVLYASAAALGIHISLAEALLAYTFGNIAAGLVPTPGGLGAAEAGIYGGLAFIGVDSSNAISITMLYRLLTYWIPIIPGYLFFWNLRKSVLANFNFKKNYSSQNSH